MEIIRYLELEKLYKLTDDITIFQKYSDGYIKRLLLNTPLIYLFAEDDELLEKYGYLLIDSIKEFNCNNKCYLEVCKKCSHYGDLIVWLIDEKYDIIVKSIEENVVKEKKSFSNEYNGCYPFLMRLVFNNINLERLNEVMLISETDFINAFTIYLSKTIATNAETKIGNDVRYLKRSCRVDGNHGFVINTDTPNYRRQDLVVDIDKDLIDLTDVTVIPGLESLDHKDKIINMILDNKSKVKGAFEFWSEFYIWTENKDKLFDKVIDNIEDLIAKEA